jgi:predicted nucleic acid-binding protein
VSVYVDASAFGAMLNPQTETPALVSWLDRGSDRLVSTYLLETELRRMCVRHSIDQSRVTALLAGVSVVGLFRSDFVAAGVLAFPQLRALDALHLQGALRLDARAILTYDRRLGEAARSMGLEVVAPA